MPTIIRNRNITHDNWQWLERTSHGALPEIPPDGDIIVPIHTVAVIGTTDEKVSDPERLRIEPWEVQLMLDEGEKMIPGISQARVLRAWAGVRPLYQEGFTGESRDATRSLTLLDHRQRNALSGFLTITGGKWTTFRLMAETTMDKACEQLGTQRPCATILPRGKP